MADVAGKKKGFFSNNLFPKILILIAAGVVVASVLFGLPTSLGDGFWFIIKIMVAIGLFVLAIKVMEKVVTGGSTFSPTESWDKKLIRGAAMAKPPRTRKLSLRAEDGHMHYYLGNVTGLLKVPHWTGKPEVDAEGKYIYVKKLNKDGSEVLDATGKPIMVNKKKNVTDKDFDWVIIVSRGLFPALAQKIKVRCDSALCSKIGEHIWIKDVNLVPIGDWWYPSTMFQADILRVNQQSLDEIVQESHFHFLDMTATTVESALRSDPMFVKMMSMNTENISSKEGNSLQQLGR